MVILNRPGRLIPLIVACALFMENLDATIIATALPQIAQALHEEPLHLSLAITSYLLSLAVFIPLSGWIADRYGARRVFRTAIVLFTLGSVCCGLSQSMPQLVAARVLQGLGGAMMTPVGRLVLLRNVPKNELVSAMSWLTIPALVGPVLGPPLGGLIVSYASWRWIFFINLPIGLLGFYLVSRFIPETAARPGPQPLDGRGWALLGIGCALLVAGFENLGKGLIADPLLAALIVCGAASLLGYVRHTRTRAQPIIDLTLLRLPSFRAAVGSGSLYRISIGAYTLLMPLTLQLGFGYSPLVSGATTFVSALGAIVMKAAAPRIVKRYGFRPLMIRNALLSAAFLVGCGLLPALDSRLIVMAWLLAYGFFRSLEFTCINTLGFAEVDEARMSQATSFTSTLQQLSLSMGVALASQLLALSRTLHGGGALLAVDFAYAFAGAALLCVLAALGFTALPANAGANVSGHRAGP